MKRRQFLTASLATSALTLAGESFAQPAPNSAREFYQIRRYSLVSGPQLKLTENYFAQALIPALTRMGLGPVGAMRVDFGPETPTYYLIIPGASVETLATLELKLADDQSFLEAAAPFWNATAAAPAFERVEISLLEAFAGWPKLTPPSTAATKGKRIFQLRTYESPSNRDHQRKVEMFHSGEFGFFTKSGCQPVFFGDTLIGPRMPNLTYMLTFPDSAALDAGWNAFRNDPDWKKLQADPRFAFEAIVSNITNLTLSPLDCSQI
ncbi:MAG TPA: NIPSNAP family protein [Terracidiphilus sp.]|nr:NIPSNAP family protein [Terracidiphilus sp.]